MFTTRRIDRPAIVCALACATLASAMSSGAAARSLPQNLRSPDARDAAGVVSSTAAAPPLDLRNPDARAVANALARERYYSSYGDPAPLTAPQSPVASDDTPWPPIALAIAATLAIVAAGGAQLRRLRILRRRAARATT